MEKKAKQASPGIRTSQEERDKAYRESRKWLDEHGQEYAREALGIPAPKVKGGGMDPDSDPYRKAREWLAEHGDEKARQEMEPTANVMWDGTKWIAKQAGWEAAKTTAKRYLPSLLAQGIKGLSFLSTVLGEWIDPPLAHAPTLEDDIGQEKKSKK